MAVGSAFDALFRRPTGVAEWPPTQVVYLRDYVSKLDCRTAVIERHYVDRDFIHDVAVLYARSLRGYPNYCQRLHLFRSEFDEIRWRQLVVSARAPEERARAEAELNDAYLGFIVVKPLPGVPVGRTVLRTWGPKNAVGHDREFPAIRPYQVHLGPFRLGVEGLAFQQQDSGVSACATTALWSALHRVAHVEGLATRTPAEITEAASRYVLADGRALPSEGLSIDQVCEAIRGADLSPLLLWPVDRDQDIGQITGYLQSGFPVVLGLKGINADTGADGHAVCVTGLKLAPLRPQTDASLHCIDGATRVRSLFIHDDRLGPYAVADIHPWTEADTGKTRTAIWIKWPDNDKTEADHCLLTAIIVPVPIKLRLTVGRLRELALAIAENVGAQFPEAGGHAVFHCRFERSSDYRQRALGFGLTDEAVFDISCRSVLSRYIGLIEVSSKEGVPLLDVLLDSTETDPNPAILNWVKRSGLPASARGWLDKISEVLGGHLFW
jgi:hypothetical protein